VREPSAAILGRRGWTKHCVVFWGVRREPRQQHQGEVFYGKNKLRPCFGTSNTQLCDMRCELQALTEGLEIENHVDSESVPGAALAFLTASH
jgi:hypothetical protein